MKKRYFLLAVTLISTYLPYTGNSFEVKAEGMFESKEQTSLTVPSDWIRSLERSLRSINKNPNTLRWQSIPQNLVYTILWHKDNYHEQALSELANNLITISDKATENNVYEEAKISKILALILKQDYDNAEKVLNTTYISPKNNFYTKVARVLIGHTQKAFTNMSGYGNANFSYNIKVMSIEEATALVKEYPNSAVTKFILAHALSRKELQNKEKSETPVVEESKALAEMKKAITLAPSVAMYQVKAAELEYSEDPNSAEAFFTNMLIKSFKDPYIAEEAGVFFAKRRLFEKAIDFLEISLSSDSSRFSIYRKLNSLYSYTQETDKAITMYERSLNKFTSKPEFYNDLAALYDKKQEYSKIIDLYSKAILNNVNTSESYSFLADAYLYNKEVDKSIAAYTEATKANPNNTEAYAKLINILWDLNNTQKVFEVSSEAVKNNPNFIMGYLWISSVYVKDNKYDEAIKIINEGIEVNPKFSPAYNSLGLIYKSKKDYDSAIKNFKSALAVNPNYVQAILNLGETYLAKGDFETAEKVVLEATKMEPYNDAVYFVLGNIYSEAKSYEKCIQAFERTILINPSSLDARNNLANVYMKQNNVDKAIEEFEAILTMNPNYATAYYNLACAYSLKKETSYSLEYLDRAISLDVTLKEVAKNDSDFNNIKNNRKFKELIELEN